MWEWFSHKLSMVFYGDDWGMVYDILIPTLKPSVFVQWVFPSDPLAKRSTAATEDMGLMSDGAFTALGPKQTEAI